METPNTQLLVVDDDPALRELLERYLTEQDYSVSSVEDAITMDAYLAEHNVDLIILDLMLPGEDGLSIAKRLQVSNPSIPILMLSARGDEIDRVVGLEMGADDYLAKPFSPRELVARIRAILRRETRRELNRESYHEEYNQNLQNGIKSPESSEHTIYSFEDFKLDITTHQFTRRDEEISLTSGEFELLKVFIEHPNRVLSRDTLVDLLKGFDRSPFDRSVDVRVTRLRRKIESDPANPHFIKTIWGTGYMFTPDEQIAT